VKIPGLQNPGKMSKSDGDNNVINLIDKPELITKKIKSAVTDSGPQIPNSEPTPSVQNLFDLMKVVSTPDTLAFFTQAYADCTIRYGDLKKQLAEDMCQYLEPIRNKIEDISSNHQLLASVAKTGAEKARASASVTLQEVRSAIGFHAF
jgi:tryptophanyl-tRNA synthetase